MRYWTTSRGPFIDASFELIDNCEFSVIGPLLVDIPGDGSWFDIWCDDQVSMFAGYESYWDLLVVPGWHGDFVNFYSDDTGFPCNPAASGTWSWAGRSGTINLLNYIPPPPPPTNDGNSRIMNSYYADFK